MQASKVIQTPLTKMSTTKHTRVTPLSKSHRRSLRPIQDDVTELTHKELWIKNYVEKNYIEGSDGEYGSRWFVEAEAEVEFECSNPEYCIASNMGYDSLSEWIKDGDFMEFIHRLQELDDQ
jgi:hypothetical protein